MKPTDNNPPPTPIIRMIPLHQIRVVNPRTRNPKKFQQLMENIRNLGLKKPIKVRKRKNPPSREPPYDLACGQGRLEAFYALEQTEIPAIVVDISREDLFLTSLAENIVRRQPTQFEHIEHIAALKDKGYTAKQIAGKVYLDVTYVNALLKLWRTGEERILKAIERGTIPVSMALKIVQSTDDEASKKILADAYESGKLRGSKLMAAKKLLADRSRYGKKWAPAKRTKKKPTSAKDLVRQYKQEVKRQKLYVKKAKLSESRLLFIVQGMKELFKDDNFINLLRAEKLDTLPKYLGDRIKGPGPDEEKPPDEPPPDPNPAVPPITVTKSEDPPHA
jgi:ParB family transcriptional regulator, chromosome partitioning protein